MLAVSPDAHAFAVLLLIAVAPCLFTRDRLPLESSSLEILIVPVTGCQLFPCEAGGVRLATAEFGSAFGQQALTAIATAQQPGVDPMPFLLAVLFGANISFATPLGCQTNLLIPSAGGCQLSGLLGVGVPLAIIIWLGSSIVLPFVYESGPVS